MTTPEEPRDRRGDAMVMYLAAVPGICILVGLGRRLAIGAPHLTGPVRRVTH